MRWVSLLILSGVLAACNSLEPTEIEAYYPVDSLVDAQYERLKLTEYQLRKTTLVNGDRDTTFITPDSTQWGYELGVFRKADINTPSLRGEYKVETENGERDGEKVVSYIPDEPDDKTVRLLRVTYLNNRISQLHAKVSDQNVVFESIRSLDLYFDTTSEDRLIRYTVDGAQKMIMKDTVRLNVTTEVLYE